MATPVYKLRGFPMIDVLVEIYPDLGPIFPGNPAAPAFCFLMSALLVSVLDLLKSKL